jgi:DNA-binding MarR family transcriptional regulator
MTKSAISKILDRLEHKGLVKRKSDPADARAQQIALTPSGRALVPRLAALADANDEHFFGHLAPPARRELLQTLRELVRVHELTQVPTE